MRLSTRLLLPLLATVALVMTAFAAWAVRQRESTLTEQAERETHAYALALGLALESAYRYPTPIGIQEIIDRISRERTIYGVLVYGNDGSIQYASDPLGVSVAAAPDPIRAAVRLGEVASLRRELDGQPVYSVVRPIRDPLGRVLGALEVAQPLSFLDDQIGQTRQRFVLNTLTLLFALTILILWLTRQMVSLPLGRFVAAARALGRGELTHRIGEPAAGRELAELADEINRMAGHLEGAQAGLLREGEERLGLERKLRQTEKLAALGNLSAGLAHEIASPLHVIRGRAEQLLRRTSPDDPAERNLRIIVEQIGRITVIVRNLLDFTRRREPHLEEIDAGGVVASVIEFLDWELGRAGIQVEWLGIREIRVMGDRDLLHQVFINLFMNSIQALATMDPGTARITVRAALTQDDEMSPSMNGRAIIEVADNGPGIPADVLPTVFEAFVTTKSTGGTGLGLAVARSIIEEHGGTIEAANGQDGGALFRVELPAARSPAEAHV
jgi:signal transduction histidine kinase